MARSRVADGGDGLQIRRVPENVLNKQSLTADKYFNLWIGRGVSQLLTVKTSLLRNVVTQEVNVFFEMK
jgi:hypothetical protein